MPTIDPDRALLVIVDAQERLVPAMSGGDGMVANTRRLLAAAKLVGVPSVVTEQNPGRLGPTVAALGADGAALAKMAFSAAGADGFEAARGGRRDVVISGCEAHVCVLQTAIALLDAGCRAFVVEDAVSSRLESSKAAALRRLERLGAEIVTAEMVIFEWLGTAVHPRFREVVALVK